MALRSCWAWYMLVQLGLGPTAGLGCHHDCCIWVMRLLLGYARPTTLTVDMRSADSVRNCTCAVLS